VNTSSLPDFEVRLGTKYKFGKSDLDHKIWVISRKNWRFSKILKSDFSRIRENEFEIFGSSAVDSRGAFD
jgi:hypothetical protein